MNLTVHDVKTLTEIAVQRVRRAVDRLPYSVPREHGVRVFPIGVLPMILEDAMRTQNSATGQLGRKRRNLRSNSK